MSKSLGEMTRDELNALPEYHRFDCVTETRPDGSTYYRRVAKRAFCFPCGPNDPMCWSDADGNLWTPVKTETGWAKERR